MPRVLLDIAAIGWGRRCRSVLRPYARPALALLLACALGSATIGHVPLVSASPNGEMEETVYLRYAIDRSQVPDWVTARAVTLVIDIGPATVAWAWADGKPLPIRAQYMADAPGDGPASGTLWATTDADEVLVAIQGEGVDLENIGSVKVATLKDDKAWALSLTFDDGFLSVRDYALPELRRYGYRAGVAVIGRWLDRDDSAGWGYCGRDELSELVAAGWGMFNHSYSSFDAPADISYEEAIRCQEAIRRHLPVSTHISGGEEGTGYASSVFTVPFANPLWVPVIDDSTEALGLYLTQIFSDDGARLALVDDPTPFTPAALAEGSYHITRDDIKDWVEAGYNYFDQAHGASLADPPGHAWVSLHAHRVGYGEDWCALAEAAAYVYHTYGPGQTCATCGRDQVWVAPSDEVLQYLVLRAATEVTLVAGELGPRVAALPAASSPTLVVYQQGLDGYAGSMDTRISQLHPWTSYGTDGQVEVRIGGDQHSSVLLSFELVPPQVIQSDGYKQSARAPKPAVATDIGAPMVSSATLSLYALSQSNLAGLDLNVYSLRRAWDPGEANWMQASRGEDWELPGARAASSDRAALAEGTAHVEGCWSPALADARDELVGQLGSGRAASGALTASPGERWFTFDVTDWVSHQANTDAGQGYDHGLIIEGSGGAFKGLIFASSEYWKPELRPKLAVRYEWPLPDPTPTPTPPSRRKVLFPLIMR